MRRPGDGSATTASRADFLVCPGCGCGQLQPPRSPLSRLLKCDHCECAFDNPIVETLKQIVALPEALGEHSCECGHPEMRRLPDGAFHCPACRAEVLPVSIPVPRPVAGRRSLATSVQRIGENRVPAAMSSKRAEINRDKGSESAEDERKE
jgi:uncharacterized Zn finger protein (UPF0148 family)